MNLLTNTVPGPTADANVIDRSVDLLELCQRLQSENDGVDRPLLGAIDRTKTLDDFAQRVNESITHVMALHHLLPCGAASRISAASWSVKAKSRLSTAMTTLRQLSPLCYSSTVSPTTDRTAKPALQ